MSCPFLTITWHSMSTLFDALSANVHSRWPCVAPWHVHGILFLVALEGNSRWKNHTKSHQKSVYKRRDTLRSLFSTFIYFYTLKIHHENHQMQLERSASGTMGMVNIPLFTGFHTCQVVIAGFLNHLQSVGKQVMHLDIILKASHRSEGNINPALSGFPGSASVTPDNTETDIDRFITMHITHKACPLSWHLDHEKY